MDNESSNFDIKFAPDIRKVKGGQVGIYNSDFFGDLTVVKSPTDTLYFIGTEVAEKLEYARPGEAVTKLVKDKYKVHFNNAKLALLGIDSGRKGVDLITESGLYSLVMKSKTENAELFQDWVFEEVLPSIRKSGKVTEPIVIPEVKPTSDEVITNLIKSVERLEQSLLYLSEKIQMKEDFTKLLLPQATGWNYINKAINTVSVMDFAKMTNDSFGLGEKGMLDKLVEMKIFMLDNKGPYQRYINVGHFKIICNSIGDRMYARTRVTGKGVNWLIKKIAIFESSPPTVARLSA